MKKIILFITLFISASYYSFGQQGIITTIAGTGTAGFSGDGGLCTNAMLNNPKAICISTTGDIYFGDHGTAGPAVRKIDASTGIIHTIAGNTSFSTGGDGGPAINASFAQIDGMCIDTAGNLYISDISSYEIRRIDAFTGVITSILTGYYAPSIATGPPGYLYFCSTPEDQVKKVEIATGIVTNIAGNGTGATNNGDGGPATDADLQRPYSVATDAAGNLYIGEEFSTSVNEIRKVGMVTGIITTVAGGGTDIADGIPATNAALQPWQWVAVDYAGNIYISSRTAPQRLRKVDAQTGLIYTIGINSASTAAFADGIDASVAMIDPVEIALDLTGNLYYTDADQSKIRKIASPSIASATDSFVMNVSKFCSGPQIELVTPHYLPGRSVKTYFGDGLTDSSTITPWYTISGGVVIDHPFSVAGNYTIKHVLYAGAAVEDSISYTYNYNFCRSLPLHFFYDANADCVKDSSETLNNTPKLVAVDSNGVRVDTVSATSGLQYNAYCTPGDIYTFRMLPITGGLFTICPASGFISDTAISASSSYPAKYFGLSCPGAGTFDLSVNAVIPVTGLNDQVGMIYASNKYCTPTDATVTIHFSPKYTYGSGWAIPTPTSVSGNSISWNLGGLTADVAGPTQLYYVLIGSGSPGPVAGDTAQSFVTISPVTGDADTSNNSQMIIDTISAASDPNEMFVSPAGCLSSGAAPNQLQYTISFTNTGNDTAFNIYVMDTLAHSLDVQSLRIVSASADMNIQMIRDGVNNIVRFDFPHINLLDSMDYPSQCHGAVIFTINTISGLPYGATISNRAGIYFDTNPVVMTNQAENIIGCPVASVNEVRSTQEKIYVYPNPAADELTIKMDVGSYNSLTITNTIGQEMMKQPLPVGGQTTVSVNTLPPGLYYIVCTGTGGTATRKFVKL